MKNLLAKLNFKLTKLHLFLILVSVLILASLGFSVKEYFDGKGQVAEADSADKSPQDSEKKDKNFESMIADLEDVVIPGRRKASGRHHHDKQGRHWPGAHGHSHGGGGGGGGGGGDAGGAGKGGSDEKKEGAESKEADTDAPTTEETITTEPAAPMAPVQNAFPSASGGVDLSKYILKSEVVPPVCPKCPDAAACPRPKPCAPCPPCARCPEPAFECKKVPNYNAMSASNVNGTLPLPRLNSFAQFN